MSRKVAVLFAFHWLLAIDIDNNLNFEDEEFDSLVKVELILHIFLYWS